MTNEIKEILDKAKEISDYGADGKQHTRMFNQFEAKALLDYITNLQNTNKNHSKKLIELGDKITNLQEKNNELKKIIDIRECQLEEMQMNKTDYTQVNILEMQLEDYKTRNNKAIEYNKEIKNKIEKHLDNGQSYDFIVAGYLAIFHDTLEEILRGDDNEND